MEKEKLQLTQQKYERSQETTMNNYMTIKWTTQKKYKNSSVQFSSVTVMSDSLQPHELQHARPPCPSPTPGVHPDSCPLSRWCHPAISSSVVPFSSLPQSLPASGSFPTLHMRWPKYWSFSFSISLEKYNLPILNEKEVEI